MNFFQSRLNHVIEDRFISPVINNALNGINGDNDLNGGSNKINGGKKNSDYIELDKSIVEVNKTNNGGNVIKLIIILFLLYIIISSNIFSKVILSMFGGKLKNGVASCFGVVIRGILLVCFYMLFAYLVNKGVI